MNEIIYIIHFKLSSSYKRQECICMKSYIQFMDAQTMFMIFLFFIFMDISFNTGHLWPLYHQFLVH